MRRSHYGPEHNRRQQSSVLTFAICDVVEGLAIFVAPVKPKLIGQILDLFLNKPARGS